MRLAPFIALLAMWGCTTPAPQASPESHVIGSITVAEAQGLSQPAFRRRLGLSADDRVWVDAVYLEDGQIGYVLTRDTLVQGTRCPRVRGISDTQMTLRGAGAFAFRNDRLVGATSGSDFSALTINRPISPDGLISLMCVYGPRRVDGSTGTAVGDAIMVAPWTPLLAAGAVLMALEPGTDAHLLSTIRVGEQLPGGNQHFLETNRSRVQVESQDGAETRLVLRRSGATSESRTLARLWVRDDIVVRIETLHGCLLRGDGSVACGDRD